jgi:nitrate/nitrite transporter NarK
MYIEEQLGIEEDDLGLLIAIYSLPNLVMVFLGGILLDRIGYNKYVIPMFGVTDVEQDWYLVL